MSNSITFASTLREIPNSPAKAMAFSKHRQDAQDRLRVLPRFMPASVFKIFLPA